MTTPHHPITPPPELVQEWLGQFFGCTFRGELSDSRRFLTTRAAQWGADQELDACCERLTLTQHRWELAADLRAARRPKPPSLAEEALKRAAMLEELARACGHDSDDTIRRALERLQELEGGDG